MVRKKRPRKKIPADHETAVLMKSARRCPLCFYLKGDLEEKHGQIAHLDGDRTNGAEDNLAFTCLPHHSLFDSRTSQHKNYTVRELKAMRRRLYAAIARRAHTAGPTAGSGGGRDADRQTLAALIKLMATTGSVDWLRRANFAGHSFDWKRLDGIERFVSRNGPEYEFVDPKVEKLRKVFYDASLKLVKLLAVESAPVGDGNRQAIPEGWEEGPRERFARAIEKVHAAADVACDSYDTLVRTARKKLLS